MSEQRAFLDEIVESAEAGGHRVIWQSGGTRVLLHGDGKSLHVASTATGTEEMARVIRVVNEFDGWRPKDGWFWKAKPRVTPYTEEELDRLRAALDAALGGER